MMMMIFFNNKYLVILVILLHSSCLAQDFQDDSNKESSYRALIEEGRTLVHHTLKRFMIILPAIFFKLGIAFTLLVLVAIAAVNNGFIGFLLLTVGLSSVLARFQENRRPVSSSLPYLTPFYHQQAHILDRSDQIPSPSAATQYFRNSLYYNPNKQ